MQTLIIALLFISFIADQLMQPEAVMFEKQKSFTALGLHTFFYCMPIFFFTLITEILFPASHVIWLAIIMAPVHFITEFICFTFAGRFYESNLRRSYIFVTMLEHLLINSVLIVSFFHLLKP